MRKVERKLSKAQITTICLLVLTLLFTSAYFLVVGVMKNKQSAAQGTKPPLDLLPGESSYLNQPVAYPSVDEGQILAMEITNPSGRFGVSRYPDDLGSFMFHYYMDGVEGVIPYTPPIYSAEGEFEYESLYAVETGDGYGMIYYLTYLCTAVGTPYFTERIELPEDNEANKERRDALLREYGFSGDDYATVSFVYAERDKQTNKVIEGTEDYHVVLIGKKAVSGNGYYFMVDGRNYVYYTAGEYFSYALAGFNEFVKGMLVAEGLDGESTYGPYLTTDFKSWINTVYDKSTGEVENPLDADKVLEDSEVVFTADIYSTIDNGVDFVPSASDFDGFRVDAQGVRASFDLSALKNHRDYERIRGALVGQSIGKHDTPIRITLTDALYNSEEKLLELGEGGSLTYEYVISSIDAILKDGKELNDGVVESNDVIKVTYRYKVGEKSTAYDLHAVLELADLSDENRAKLTGVSVGKLAVGNEITLPVVYTEDNALSSIEKYVLTGIVSIFNEDGEIVDAVEESSFVNISYYYTVDGVIGDTQTAIVRLCDIKDDSRLAPLKTILLGKGKGELKATVYDATYYYEVFRGYSFYEISEIGFCVTSELVASFNFQNASLRDPYYGESFYENTLDNEYKLYGLNASVCEGVVMLLGGIGSDSSNAVGLAGKTVAVGLTVENMEKYGLYAHRIYFELPRGLYDASEGKEGDSDDALSDFAWLSTLGFTLYISEETIDEDGNAIRYIGSDMYDLVAQVDAKDFEFLDESFVDFWARRNLIMMDITKLDRLSLEFEMEDLNGTYDFEVIFKELYVGYVDGKYYESEEAFEGYTSTYEQERVNVRASEDATETELKKLLDATDNEWYSLAALYNKTMGDGTTTQYYPGSRDTLGAAYFNNTYEILQLTRYQGILTEQERQDAYANAPRVMRMHIRVQGSSNFYTYDFYRIDDRRVMVSLYRTDKDGNKIASAGEVSDFYITSFAFKKLVRNYVSLLNGEEIDGTVGYDD